MGDSFIWMLIDQKYKKSCGFIEKVEALLFNLTRDERYSRRASQEGQELPLT